MKKKGAFIVLDGIDGSGKGTQITLLKKNLSDQNIQAHFTREPGGSPHAEEIRKVILSPAAKDTDALTHFLLFWAARNEHMHTTVIPLLNKGINIFSDRLDSSTLAFQLYGEECLHLKDRFFAERENILGSHAPDLYIIFDLSPEAAFLRMKHDAGRQQSHFDLRPIEYHTRVRNGFREFAKHFPCAIVDADRSEDRQ